MTGGGIASLGPARWPQPATATLPDAVTPSPAPAQPPPNSALEQPESTASSRRWLGLDRLGVLQVLGGLDLSLIAVFSSYDHITILGRTLQLQQQWGIVFIAASLATVFVDAELASGSRLRAAHVAVRAADTAFRATQDAARAENEAARERNLASEERQRAAEARELQAEAATSQRESLEDIRRGVFLSARVQLDPTDSNRARLQAFLALMAERPVAGEEGA